MADGLNRVMLMGNVGADPGLRQTNGGQAVLRLRLATSESYKDRDGSFKERTEWHSVVVWGKRAEALGRILTKGSKVFVEGSLRTTSYDDKDGNKRYKTEINASNIILGGSAPGGGSSGGQQRRAPSGGDDFSGGDSAPADPGFGSDDDIPF